MLCKGRKFNHMDKYITSSSGKNCLNIRQDNLEDRMLQTSSFHKLLQCVT